MNSSNTIAKIFSIIAIITFILGGIGSIIIMANADEMIGLICLISVFVSGMLFMGLAEIIKLLQICADNTAKQPKFFTGEASIVADMEAELPDL